MISPGTQLEKLCIEASNEVLLVAPFIKAAALKRLLVVIPNDVTVRCITRWQPEEIVAGVSDLEVWSLVKQRPQSSLWLRPDLHAKYYRADNKCFVGSANLTAKALGWSNTPNLELLVPFSANEPILKTFEADLLAGCIEVNESFFEQILTTVQLLEEKANHLFPLIVTPTNSSTEEFSCGENTIPAEAWLPTLRNPQDLYLAYSGQQEKLTTAAREAAIQDLCSLPVIPNLPQKAFEAYVGTLLLQKPIIQRVDAFVKMPQRFGAVRNLLNSLPCAKTPNFNPNRAWQTLMRWLLYFLPHRYALSVPNYSEIFYRIKTEK